MTMWKKKPKDEAVSEPGFRKPVRQPPEIIWSESFYDPDTEIEFRVGLQWRGTGPTKDGIMLIYQTHNAGRWISYNIGVVPRCALQWISRNIDDVERLRGPMAEIEELHRRADIVEIISCAKHLEAFAPKEEKHVSDQKAWTEEVESPRWRKTVSRNKKR